MEPKETNLMFSLYQFLWKDEYMVIGDLVHVIHEDSIYHNRVGRVMHVYQEIPVNEETIAEQATEKDLVTVRFFKYGLFEGEVTFLAYKLKVVSHYMPDCPSQ